MFDRIKYKKFAKVQLKNRWLIPVLMTLITSIIMIVLQLPDHKDFIGTVANFSMDAGAWGNYITSIRGSDATFLDTLRSWIGIFIGFIFTVAQIHVYLKMSRGPEPVKMGDFMEGLSHWWRAICAGLWQSIWVFLWLLLFIIPGIVKCFAYSQMFYLIAEYPELSVRKAMKISIAITRGHKGELLLMNLSFIGWALLAVLTGGIGFLWLNPYITMSMTNAYHGMMKDALSSGIIKSEDLIG